MAENEMYRNGNNRNGTTRNNMNYNAANGRNARDMGMADPMTSVNAPTALPGMGGGMGGGSIPTTPVAPGGGIPLPPNMENIPTTPVAPGGGMPIPPNMENIPTTPVAPGGGMPIPPNIENIPTTPVAPGGGIPIPPNIENIPTTPVAPGGGIPIPPNMGNIPTTPVAPGGPVFPEIGFVPSVSIVPGPSISFPTFPSCPNCPSYPVFPSFPSTQNYGQVRFLNASTNSFPVNISIDNTTYAINSRFGTITNYDWIADGFHTVTVRRATGLRTVLLQQTFPFAANQKVTMVLVDTGSGGLNMIRVSDTGCNNLPYNAGCYRVANMSYSGSSYDLQLSSGETVFRNVGFQEVTPYKQAMAGSYQFFVTNSSNLTVVREIPIIVIGTFPSTGMVNQALATFPVNIMAGRNYTSYLIGNTWSDNNFRVLTVED